jgi:hypothetical protein
MFQLTEAKVAESPSFRELKKQITGIGGVGNSNFFKSLAADVSPL